MNRPGSVGLVVLAVVVTVAGIGGPLAVVGATASPQASTSGTASVTGSESTMAAVPASLQSQEFDSTTFEVTVYENGSATWTLRHEMQLNESEVEDFETTAEEFESNESDTYEPLYKTFVDQAHALAGTGSNATDREMEARDFTRSAYVEEEINLAGGSSEVGVVEMSFTWDGFAAVEGGTVKVGDVFNGLYIYPDQSIVFRAGGDLVFESVAPDGAEYATTELENADEVIWSGEREFIDGHPRVVFDNPNISAHSSGPISTLTSAVGDLLWPLVALAILVGIGGAVVWYRRSDDGATEATTESPAPAPPADRAGGRSQEAPGEPDDADDGGLPDEELLTDDDRVVKLIRENGGRMKQVNIVEETGWSKSKVSMLLSDMEEEGTISKLRVGRENIISLEGFEPEATKSPFEE
ncbi:helix-turn-helix transcriptional regulator [Halosolutus halophilus]|uniref:helix-turn-helix transcriptional regulator n=1 Tax=Halosolutus halophilus TaxID=1552990 RepID=UPI0022350FF2|nr:helix-turn-helix domain-containing protein [Halosolutus halophilus]